MSAEVWTGPDPDSALSWAYRYVHKGWAVLPVWSAIDGRCECGHPHDGTNGLAQSSIGKHPVRGLSWTDASTDVATIETWFTDTAHSIAIVPALSGLFAVDVDGPAGEAELVVLETEHGELPATLTDRSGRQDGGRHLFFTTEQTPPSRNLADHIDTRGAVGYVIVAPSMHQSGRRYEWQNWTAAPAPLPAWIVEKLQPQRAPTVDADAEPLPDPVPPWLTLRFTEKPVDGTRHRRHYAFVARCVEMGLSNGQILTAVAKHSPSTDKFGRRLKAETLRVLGKVVHLRDHHNEEHRDGDVEDRLRTDVGNADRLIDDHGHRFRHVGAWGTWLVWDGRRWARDEAGLIIEAAKATAVRMVREAADIADPEERAKALRWATGSENLNRIRAMVDLARSIPGIPVEPDDLDADAWKLNGGQRDHQPADRETPTARPGRSVHEVQARGQGDWIPHCTCFRVGERWARGAVGEPDVSHPALPGGRSAWCRM